MKITLIGEFKQCLSCEMEKSRQKQFPKIITHQSTICGEMIYMDIIYINHASFGGYKYWRLVVDEATRFKWSKFVTFKNEMALMIVNRIKEMNQLNMKVSYVR